MLFATVAIGASAMPAHASAADFGCTATPLNITLLNVSGGGLLGQANPAETPCANDDKTLLSGALPIGVGADVVTSQTRTTGGPVNADHEVSAETDVEGLDVGLNLLGINLASLVSLGTATTTAQASCPITGAVDPVVTGNGTLVGASVLGTPITVDHGAVIIPPLNVPPLGALSAQVVVNDHEQTATSDTFTALHVAITLTPALGSPYVILGLDVGTATVDHPADICSQTSGAAPSVTVQAGTNNREVTAQTTPASTRAHDAVTTCTISARPHSGGTFTPVSTTFDDATGVCSAKLPAATFPGPGQYDVQAVATDSDPGDVGTSSIVTIDVAVPTLTPPTLSGRTISAAVTPAPGAAITDCSFALTPAGGGSPQTVHGTYTSSPSSCSATLPASIVDGDYTATATATDVNGDSGTSAVSGTLQVSGGAPTVAFDGGQANRHVSATATPSGGATIADCTIQVRPAGGGSFTTIPSTLNGDTCTATVPQATYPPGDYDVQATVHDSNNQSGTASTAITIGAPTVSGFTADQRELSAHVTPATGAAITDCSFQLDTPGGGTAGTFTGSYDAGTGDCTLTLPSTVADGHYDVTTRAVDVNGDSGTLVTPGAAVSGTAPTATLNGGQPNRQISATGHSPDGEALTGCTVQARRSGTTDYTTVHSDFNTTTGVCTATLPHDDFPDAGGYDVHVTVTDASGDTGSADGGVTVLAPTVATPTATGRDISAAVTPVPGVAIVDCSFVIGTPDGGVGAFSGSYDAAAGACTGTVPDGAPDGSYNVAVTATDANGDSGTGSTTTPLAITGIKPTVTLDPDQPNRHVSATVGSPDGETITSCTITGTPHAGGTPVTLTGTLSGGHCTTTLPRASFPAGDYDVTVTVTDQSGDSASDSGTITVVTPQVAPPTADGRTLSAAVTPAPGIAISSCSFGLTPLPNGSPTSVTGTYAGGTCTATVPAALADGAYKITAAALDANNDFGTATSDSVAVSGTKPTVTLDNGQPNRHVSATVGSPDGEAIASCTVTAAPHGGGTPVTLTGTLTGTHCTADLLPRGSFPAGQYDITVSVTDASGDSASDSGTITVSGPQVDAPTASGRTVSAAVTPAPGVAISSCSFTLTPAAGGASTNVSGSFAAGACTATVPTSLADGSYDLTATATDANGDSGTAASTGHVTVSGTKPTVTLDSGEPNRVVSATGHSPDGETIADCTITATPHGGGTTVTLDETLDPSGKCTAAMPRSSFPAGDYDIAVSVTDQTGDTGTTSGTVSIVTPTVAAPQVAGRALSAAVTPAPGVGISTCSFTLTPAGGGSPTTLDGTYSASPSACAITLPSTVHDGDYTVVARATDANGDSGMGTSTGTLHVSGTAPTVTLDANQPNRDVSATVTSPDGEAISGCTVEAKADGGSYATVPSDYSATTGKCTATLPRDDYPAGASYSIRVTATDASGDTGTVTGALAVAAPAVTAPTVAGRTVSTGVTPAPGVAIASCTFTLTPSGGGAPSTLNGSYDVGTNTCSAVIPASTHDGSYDVVAHAVDANGDSGQGSANGLAVSGTAPVVTLDGDQPNRGIAATGSSPDGETLTGCTVEVRLAGSSGAYTTLDEQFDAATGKCSATLPHDSYPPGDYEVRVSETDQSGDSGTVSGTVTVTAPTIGVPATSGRTISAPVTPAPGVAIASCTFTLTPAGGGSGTTVNGHYDAGSGACTATAPSSLPDGAYDVHARVVDANGDSGESSTTTPVELSGTAPTVTLDPDQPNREISATGSSPDGETLSGCTVEVRPSGGGSYTTLPSHFDPSTGKCTATLPHDGYQPGGYDVRVTVIDDGGDSGQVTGTVTVAAPSVGDPVNDDGTIVIPITPAPDTPITSCTVTITPAGGSPTTIDASYDAASGSCRATLPSGTTAGDATVETQVTDANGDTGTGSGTITIAGPVETATPTATATASPTATPVATPTATPAPQQIDNPFTQGSAKDIVLACTTRNLVLTNVQQIGRQVLITGVAADKYVGQRVKITFAATKKTVATVTVGTSGEFQTRVKAPSAKVAKSNKARYTAQIGSDKSAALKLSRRMADVSVSESGGKVTIRGVVSKPLAKGRQTVTVTQLVSCGKYTKVGTAKLDAHGRYTLRVKRPAGVHAALYRASTKVATRANGPARSTTFTLPLPLDL